jgi:asparagine N-glycosylation enzyme membrane subunit Stt3
MLALGAWVVVAPLLTGAAEPPRLGPEEVIPSLAAVAAGSLVLAGPWRAVWPGGLLALAAGVWLVVRPIADAGAMTLQWMVFSAGAGVVISLLGLHVLGLLEPRPGAEPRRERRAHLSPAPPCQHRRRRASPLDPQAASARSFLLRPNRR